MNIEDAIVLACVAHKGQVDKCGEPYIFHPIHVMLNIEDNDEKVVAVLHDVLEDSNITKEYLIENGISETQLNALTLLTRVKNQSYKDYIKQLSVNKTAVKVKKQDLLHNLNTKRVPKNEDCAKTIARQTKYKNAYLYLVTGSDSFLNNL